MRIAVVLSPNGGATSVTLGEHDAHAVEEAIRIRERLEPATTEVVAVSLAPAETLGAVREALALGVDRAVLVDDASVRHLDVTARAVVLAVAVQSVSPDLVLACAPTADIDGLLLWHAIGSRLRLPVITQAAALAVTDEGVEASRQSEGGDQTLWCELPVMVEVTTGINKLRYPTLKARSAAQQRPIDLIQPDALGVDAPPPAIAIGETRPAQRARTTQVVTDPLSAPAAIVEFLQQRRLL